MSDPLDKCKYCRGEGILTTDQFNGDGYVEDLPVQVSFECPCTFWEEEYDDWSPIEEEGDDWDV